MNKFLIVSRFVICLFLTVSLKAADVVEGLKAFGFNEKPLVNYEIIPTSDAPPFVESEDSKYKLRIKTNGINEAISQQLEQSLREAQKNLMQADYGEEIIFAMSNGIWVQNADGTRRRQLIAKSSDYLGLGAPAWSLDGKSIAFAGIRSNDYRIVDIYVADADGSNINFIYSLSAGYYSGSISSISWSWDNQYIMFVYGYDDVNLNTLFVVCTIHRSGSSFSFGDLPDVMGAQYEPVTGSSRYVYTTGGRPFYFNSDLCVSNLNGTNNIIWFHREGVISGFRDVTWINANSLCAVTKEVPNYPGKEVLIRFDKSGQTINNYALIISDQNGKLYSPSFSPNRLKLYMAEAINNLYTLWYTEWNSQGQVITNVSRGGGSSPNWRQALPLPDKPVLLDPPNYATDVSINPVLQWQSVSGAVSYELYVYTQAGDLVYHETNITSTSRQIGPLLYDSVYIWMVKAKSYIGESPFSHSFRFTTESASGLEDIDLPLEFTLRQNYPNPFNPITTIEYYMHQNAEVKLIIYDILGNEVKKFVQENQQPGVHKINWDGSNYKGQLVASGLYFYRIDIYSGKQSIFTDIKKMFLIR